MSSGLRHLRIEHGSGQPPLCKVDSRFDYSRRHNPASSFFSNFEFLPPEFVAPDQPISTTHQDTILATEDADIRSKTVKISGMVSCDPGIIYPFNDEVVACDLLEAVVDTFEPTV